MSEDAARADADRPNDPIPDGALIVGIAGGPLDDTCLAWAAGAATRTRRPLHLLHAFDVVTTFSALEPAMISAAALSESTDEVTLVEAVLEQARREWPELSITGSEPIGRPERLLIEASETAYVLVVGAPERRGLERLLGRSSLAVAMHAACPVVIVPEGTRPDPEGPVVAAVDGSEHSRRALERAFWVARTRGERLVAVTSWYTEVVDGVVVTTPGTDAWNVVEARHRGMVQVMVDKFAHDYPDVEVEIRVMRGPAAQVITDLSDEAGILVLGSRGRGGFRGMLLGSVTQRVIETATCPVIVVRVRED